MEETSVTPECRIIRNVRVPMRDGVELATTVILPLAEGRYPTVLVRTSYRRITQWEQGLAFARNGYAFVVQDCRGRWDSDGEWYPFTAEAHDGYDTLEWLGDQPWCDGNVGMFGASYLAGTQFLAAPEGSKYLRALIPMFMTGDPWRRAYYADGAFSLALNLIWLCFEVCATSSDFPIMDAYDMAALFRKLPLIELDIESGYEQIPFWRDYVRHHARDDYWEALSIRDKYHAFTMPSLLIGGWYDYYPKETFRNYLAIVEHASSAELARRHKVIIGPWGHGFSGSSEFGDLDFGEQSVPDAIGLYCEWFDATLKDGAAGSSPAGSQWVPEAPIRIFVMGANTWRDEYEWPLARTEYVKYYLHSNGAANSPGVLSTEMPADEPPDNYTYDPLDPVPTLGGNHSVGLFWEAARDVIRPGPFDQRPIEQRDDVLVYTTEPLDEDTEITGPVTLKLYAASSAPDTDFVAKLTDVYPNGRSINITEGVIRARFREMDWENPTPIVPHTIYEYTIDLQVTSNVFKQGHCIRVDVTSSNFPLWDRNPNTGHKPGMDAELRPADQTIYHDRQHPSHIILPIIPV